MGSGCKLRDLQGGWQKGEVEALVGMLIASVAFRFCEYPSSPVTSYSCISYCRLLPRPAPVSASHKPSSLPLTPAPVSGSFSPVGLPPVSASLQPDPTAVSASLLSAKAPLSAHLPSPPAPACPPEVPGPASAPPSGQQSKTPGPHLVRPLAMPPRDFVCCFWHTSLNS